MDSFPRWLWEHVLMWNPTVPVSFRDCYFRNTCLDVEGAVWRWVHLLTRDEGDPGHIRFAERERGACILGISHLHAWCMHESIGCTFNGSKVISLLLTFSSPSIPSRGIPGPKLASRSGIGSTCIEDCDFRGGKRFIDQSGRGTWSVLTITNTSAVALWMARHINRHIPVSTSMFLPAIYLAKTQFRYLSSRVLC